MDFDQWGNGQTGNGHIIVDFGGYDDPMDDGEEDEREDMILRVAACMSMLPGDEFDQDVFENACYMANVNPDEFTEQDLEKLIEVL